MTENNPIPIAIGIDLGTTYSCVGIWENNSVTIIPNQDGNRTTASCVSFGTERLIGDQAKAAIRSNPTGTIYGIKRLMGRHFSDPTVQEDMKYWPFSVVSDQNDKPLVSVNETQFNPEEISAMILSKMKEIAETHIGKQITNAVITVPAYFNDAQRQATKDAGTIAGLNVLRIINEPTAAAMAYGFERSANKECVLVFDLGGGTFDVSLLVINNGVYEIKATAGDTHLGGEDFDNALVDYLVGQFKTCNTGHTLSSKAIITMKREAERVKKNLSTSLTTEVDVTIDGIDFTKTISRALFEELNSENFEKCLDPVKKVLIDANVLSSEIDEIVLVGGSTRIPKIQELLKEFFEGKELSKAINPDEAVAYGAAIQAALLVGMEDTTGKLDNTVLLDITPLSLGLETVGGCMTVLIPRNTTIPVSKKHIFSTYADNQESVLIKVYEGERSLVKDNNLLGEFRLSSIPPMPRGSPQIEIDYSIDANGILGICAIEKTTGNKSQITITNDKNHLNKEEISKMISDSEKFKEKDKTVRELIHAKNDLEHYCYTLKNSMQKLVTSGDVSREDETKMIGEINSVLDWFEKNSESEVKENFVEKLKWLQDLVVPIVSGTKQVTSVADLVG